MGAFRDKVQARKPGILTYGLTPPRAANDRDQLHVIAERQRARLAALPVDALILYDLQDESSRDASPRPFAFLPTLDPFDYQRDYLGDAGHELIVYRAVADHGEDQFGAWLAEADQAPTPAAVTLVGSPSRAALPGAGLHLSRAYELYTARCQRLLLGGICIAERHAHKADEHLRILHKQALGCSFFVSQAVYDEASSLTLFRDLAREAAVRAVETVPLLLTITPCGNEKTLQFMKWLGISFAPEVELRLRSSADMLAESVTICEDLIQSFARQRSGPVPLGINVESVSIRRADIDAAASLVAFARRELDE
jgi:hypothetical protein